MEMIADMVDDDTTLFFYEKSERNMTYSNDKIVVSMLLCHPCETPFSATHNYPLCCKYSHPDIPCTGIHVHHL
jgi:hypothetical protein